MVLGHAGRPAQLPNEPELIEAARFGFTLVFINHHILYRFGSADIVLTTLVVILHVHLRIDHRQPALNNSNTTISTLAISPPWLG